MTVTFASFAATSVLVQALGISWAPRRIVPVMTQCHLTTVRILDIPVPQDARPVHCPTYTPAARYNSRLSRCLPHA
jgi:hypothetical protein